MTLREIDAENFWDIIDLSVAEDQTDLVTTNAVSLGQAYVQRECIPLAVYDGETPVGFVMYCIDRDDGEYWIYRLMTDRRYQRRGYARAALREVLERIRRDTTRHRVFLGVDTRGEAAVELYKSEGFAFNGQVFGKEHIMVLEY